jgi:hypothetical protein
MRLLLNNTWMRKIYLLIRKRKSPLFRYYLKVTGRADAIFSIQEEVATIAGREVLGYQPLVRAS